MKVTIATEGGLQYVELLNVQPDQWLPLHTGMTARWIEDEFLRITVEAAKDIVDGRPRQRRIFQHMTAADGFTVSVQANYGAYCEPRVDGGGPYTHVEAGKASALDRLLMAWCEAAADGWESSIYPYVPIEVIDTVLAMHDAAKRFADRDPEALALVDALWSVGVVTTDKLDVNEWELQERLALAHGLAIVDAFRGEP